MIKAKLFVEEQEDLFMEIEEVKDHIDIDYLQAAAADPKMPNIGRTTSGRLRFHFRYMDDQENGESIAVYGL